MLASVFGEPSLVEDCFAGCEAQHQQTAFAKQKQQDAVFFVKTEAPGVSRGINAAGRDTRCDPGRLSDAVADGPDGGLRSIPEGKLAEQVLHVLLHRLDADIE